MQGRRFRLFLGVNMDEDLKIILFSMRKKTPNKIITKSKFAIRYKLYQFTNYLKRFMY